MSSLSAELRDELDALATDHLLRCIRYSDGPQATRTVLDGREVTVFSSNDYLGLANDNRLREAAKRVIDQCGAGAGASRLLSGSLRIHQQLEERLAGFESEDAALVFDDSPILGRSAVGFRFVFLKEEEARFAV